MLRDVRNDDADLLAVLWQDIVRPGDRLSRIADMESVIGRVRNNPFERIVVAEYDGAFAGAVLLRSTTLTHLNLEPCVQALAPHVLPEFRRRGVGRAMVNAAVSWAEELGIGYVSSASFSSSREANRFMARLSFGPQAVLRVAATHNVRARLTGSVAARRAALGGRPVGQVLAVRRSMRRQQTTSS